MLLGRPGDRLGADGVPPPLPVRPGDGLGVGQQRVPRGRRGVRVEPRLLVEVGVVVQGQRAGLDRHGEEVVAAHDDALDRVVPVEPGQVAAVPGQRDDALAARSARRCASSPPRPARSGGLPAARAVASLTVSSDSGTVSSSTCDLGVLAGEPLVDPGHDARPAGPVSSVPHLEPRRAHGGPGRARPLLRRRRPGPPPRRRPAARQPPRRRRRGGRAGYTRQHCCQSRAPAPV